MWIPFNYKTCQSTEEIILYYEKVTGTKAKISKTLGLQNSMLEKNKEEIKKERPRENKWRKAKRNMRTEIEPQTGLWILTVL